MSIKSRCFRFENQQNFEALGGIKVRIMLAEISDTCYNPIFFLFQDCRA